MEENFSAALKVLLKHEGLWSDHPADPGGATMKGITLATYSAWLRRQATKEELRKIPDAHLNAIYRSRYWDTVRGDDLPAGVDLAVFDMSVNSGPARAARLLQQAVGAKPDGVIGPKTLAAVHAQNAAELINRYQRDRQHYLEALSTASTFGKGWARRVRETRDIALKMTQGQN